MIQIYLCDDEESVCHQLKTALEWKIFMENYDMRVVCSVSTAQELLDAAEDNSRSVYFLDVDLKDGEWDGFTLGRELRQRDPHGTLVYITGYGDLAWKTFQYHLEAFDYIVKEEDQTGAAAARCLEAVHARLLDEHRDPVEVFSLRTGDGTRHVPLADILFFETAPKAHHVYLHTADSRLDFVGSLNELEKKLGKRFIRIHRAYLAAWDKIETLDSKENKIQVGGQDMPAVPCRKSGIAQKTGREAVRHPPGFPVQEQFAPFRKIEPDRIRTVVYFLSQADGMEKEDCSKIRRCLLQEAALF